MTADRHIALRILVQAATPLALLIALSVAAPMGFGLGGPIAAGLMISLAIGLYALVFGFPALAKAAPPWILALLIAGAMAVMVGTALAPPASVLALLARFGESGEAPRAAIVAQAFGIAAVTAIVSASVLMLQAVGARAQPLVMEDTP